MGAPDFVAAVRAQIRAERGAADLSQDVLATRAGLSKMTVRRLEGGDPKRRSVPDVEQVAALCAVFGISVSAFFARAEQRLEQAPAGAAVADEVYVTPPGDEPPGPARRTRSPRNADH